MNMPIVDCSNYMPCPSCFRWMHVPAKDLHGNQMMICQECYERADGVKARGNFHLSDAEYGQCLAAQKESDARATDDKRLDLPTNNELIDIFRKTRSRGFFNVLDELRFSLGLFIELRSKKS